MTSDDTPSVNACTDLYRFYDSTNRLLYIGVSLHAAQRASQHRDDKPWWPQVDRMEVDHLPVDRTQALAVERQAIIDEHPLYNVTHNAQTASVQGGRITWRCEICEEVIEDREGYIELPQAERLRHVAELAAWKLKYPGGTYDDDSGLNLVKWDALFDRPTECHWWAIHQDCDPDPDECYYHVEIARIRTFRELLGWTLHLMGKVWFDDTDWDDLCHGVIAASQPARAGGL